MSALQERLRLMVITDPEPACGRPLHVVVRECLDSGAGVIQLRDKKADARSLATTASALLATTRAFDALLIVNDRLDVALAVGADGVHLGPDDLPVAAAHAISPPPFLIGFSTDDPERARQAAAEGASYLGIGAVYGTRSKPGLRDEAIGPARVATVMARASLPAVGIGGIDECNAADVYATGAGVAVISSVMSAPDPGERVRAILAAGR